MTTKEIPIKFRSEVELPSTTYATFGLYQYPAKFIPHIPAYILEHYSRKGMKVFDPFAGYGTVGIVAKIYGCDYEMWDLSPLIEYIHEATILKPERRINAKNIRVVGSMRFPYL